MPTKLTPEIINAAIEGFQSQKRRIDDQIAELRAMLTGSEPTATTPEAPTGKRKKFSAASRRKMAMAQKARWAAIKGTSPATPKPAKPKRRISPEGMKRIIAGTKKMWAARRAAAKKAAATKAAPKKVAGKKAAVKKASAKKSAPAVVEVTAQ